MFAFLSASKMSTSTALLARSYSKVQFCMVAESEWFGKHKSLFVKSPELIEHREAILKQFLDFGIHLVFDDIRN